MQRTMSAFPCTRVHGSLAHVSLAHRTRSARHLARPSRPNLSDDGTVSELDTPRSLADGECLVDIIPITTKVFDLIATMSEGSVLPENMRDTMTELAGSFARTVKWDIFICDLHGKGSFIELMTALAPVWEGLTITKAEVRSVTRRNNTVAIIRTVYSTHIEDGNGQVVDGTDGPMEVAVSVRFHRDKIAQWHQEFDKNILDNKRMLAKAAMQAGHAAPDEAEAEAAVQEAPAKEEAAEDAPAAEAGTSATEAEAEVLAAEVEASVAEAEPAAEAEAEAPTPEALAEDAAEADADEEPPAAEETSAAE